MYDEQRVDAGRKQRELHLEKALEVMECGRSCAPRIMRVPLTSERAKKNLLVACSYFATERWEFRATVQSQSVLENFELFVILEGSGYIHWQGSPAAYQAGQCWFMPAALGKFSLQPEQSTSVIRTWVPDLENLRAELRRFGVSEAQLAQTIFA